MNRKKGIQAALIVFLLILAAAGMVIGIQFGNRSAVEPAADSVKESGKNTASVENAAESEELTVPTPDEKTQTEISLKQDASKVTGAGAQVLANTITIKKGGTYRIHGTLTEGNVCVDAGEKDTVILLLDNAAITNTEAAAIKVKKAKHVSLHLKENTKNKLQSGTASSDTDGTSDTDGSETADDTSEAAQGSVITAKSELSMSGTGTCVLNGGRNNAVLSKKTLVIDNGTYEIQSAGDALRSEEACKITGGTFSIVAGKGSAKASFSSSGHGWGQPDADWDMTAEKETSKKAIKSGTDLYISGGTFTIDSYDDALHADGVMTIDGGVFSIQSGDDGVHAEKELLVSDGELDITQCYEGLEANRIRIDGGDIKVVSKDDGLNAFGGKNSMGGGSHKKTETMPSITIGGGTVYVNADGDGLDSNGDLTIEGGTVIVDGPQNDGNGALDYGTENGGSCTISGGTVFAAGCSGMAETFDDTSKQVSVMYNPETDFSEGSNIVILDQDGTQLYSHKAVKRGNSIIFSSPKLQKGKTCTVQIDKEKTDISLEAVVNTSGRTGRAGGGMGGAGMGGGHRQMPDEADKKEPPKKPEGTFGESPQDEKPQGERPEFNKNHEAKE